MGLLDYERRFSKLNMNAAGGRKSPHKVAMLLAVINGIQSGEITDNRIFFSKALRDRFKGYLDQFAEESDRNNPHLPFFHLRSEGFWHHQIKPGGRAEYATLSNASGPGVIERCIQYAHLDDELFELLGNSLAAELLRQALLTNLDDAGREEILRSARGWDWLECELIVQDYLAMLNQDIRGEPYKKAEHRKRLRTRLNNRSEGSIEYKHQNISAVLLELGLPYIPGYKPAFNYQQQLKQAVLAHIARDPAEFDELTQGAEAEPAPPNPEKVDWSSVFDPDPPERLTDYKRPDRRYLGRKIDFATRERLNRALGESGERFALEFERYRLTQSGRPDLAEEVKWSSREEGDGLGFDIRSFDPDYEKELFVEVKTTNSGKYQPFLISENERAFSNERASSYRLYRIYEFRRRPRLFVLPGAVEGHVHLLPQQYRAVFGD
ncbi:protein NO VEIN domain-containing protein [Wenzhouxiangella sp. EGI_FJ10409]|uniref:DUF3883 domain-containing protein n=1 Tax=Wenzhouxiangella sp. EGI_FJ10409 TaxID=3243767 RepID=UPI0035DD1CD1